MTDADAVEFPDCPGFQLGAPGVGGVLALAWAIAGMGNGVAAMLGVAFTPEREHLLLQAAWPTLMGLPVPGVVYFTMSAVLPLYSRHGWVKPDAND